MGVERAVWLDLLHREAEGELTPAERAQLSALPGDTLSRMRGELAQVTASLSDLPPLSPPGTRRACRCGPAQAGRPAPRHPRPT